MRVRIFIAAALLACASGAVAADDQPICADRPGKASQACTVPAGHFQFETSLADWTLSKGGDARDTALIIGETGVKYGLTDRSHVVIDILPWQRLTSKAGRLNDHESGFGDVLLSYKDRLTNAASPLQLAVSPVVKIPTAKRPIGNRRWEAGFVVPVQYSIPNSKLGLSFTPELDWAADADGSGHHAAMSQVANIGWQATPKLNLSAEIWGQWDWDPTGTTRPASADGAVAYLLNKGVQLDAGANFGLNKQTPDLELYTGVSLRF